MDCISSRTRETPPVRIFYLGTILEIALHLQALTQIHQALVDFSSLGKRGAGCLCISGTLGSWKS
jgi:hypothetical protein